MEISQNGLDLIIEYEGLVLEAYPDPGSKNGLPVTIGVGTTKIDGKAIKLGTKITKAQAIKYLKDDIENIYQPMVFRQLPNVTLNQNEFDALVSFVYNIGETQFSKSTVKRMILKGDKTAAAEAFGMWIKNDGKVLKGLVRRRAAEKALFLKPITNMPLNAPQKPVESDSRPQGRETPQTTDKPLSASKEIAGGILLGGGSLTQLVNSIDVSDLVSSKEGLQELKTQTGEVKDNIVFSNYIIQGASILIFLIGMFIIWKRWKDRKEGKR